MIMRRLLIATVILLALLLLYQWLTFPDVSALAVENPKSTSFMERKKNALRRARKSDRLDYRWVSYSRISPHLRRAVLVAEDSAFYEHAGVDVEGLKEALRRDWQARRFTHGGSTITQQLAKNLYLSPARTPWRKLKEFAIAWQLERQLSKKRILELYLNVVEMGERVYGAEAAARHYFGKSAAALSPAEAALLAGALPNPRRMNPADPNRRLRGRQRIILSRMRRWGHLAEQEVLTARSGERPAASDELPAASGELPVASGEPVSTTTTETIVLPEQPTQSETSQPVEETSPPPETSPTTTS